MKKLLLALCLVTNTAFCAMFTTAGNDHTISMLSNPGLVITNEITICMWVSRIAGSSPSGGMIGKDALLSPRANYTFREGSGGGPTNVLDFFYMEYGTSLLSQWRTADNAYVDDVVLHFVALTYNYADSNSVKVYVNGALKTGAWIANIPTGRGPTNDGSGVALTIGQGGNNDGTGCSGGQRWLGYYSEVAIWNSILRLDQLELIRNSKVKGIQKQINTDTLKLYLPIDSVPDNVTMISQGSVGASEFPDRKNFGPKAYRCAGATHPIGRGEIICSYPPNE